MHLMTNPMTAGFRHEAPTRVELDVGALLLNLRAQRCFRVEQLRELVGNTAEALANADQARLQVSDLLAVAAETALADIDGALERLEAGTYGTCSGCDQAIAWRRLQMLPTARLCTMCHYLSERPSGHPSQQQGLGHAGPATTTATTSPSAGLS